MLKKSEDDKLSLNNLMECDNRESMNSMKEESNSGVEYTDEQFEVVKKILKCSSYYQMFGITKKTLESGELKKRYRLLSLLLHPDKNKAPRSSEAFIKINIAFHVLSDSLKRSAYDIYNYKQETIGVRKNCYFSSSSKRQNDFNSISLKYFNWFCLLEYFVNCIISNEIRSTIECNYLIRGAFNILHTNIYLNGTEFLSNIWELHMLSLLLLLCFTLQCLYFVFEHLSKNLIMSNKVNCSVF